jgi:hypothetical protein
MDISGLQQTYSGKNLFKNQLIPQRNKFLLDECKSAAKRMGQTKVDEEVFVIASKDLISEVEENFSHYSLDEISDVMRRGAIGELGDNISISARTILSWFRVYKTDVRPKLTKKMKPSSAPQLSEGKKESRTLTQEEVAEYLKFVRECFDSGEPLYSVSYDIFHEAGLTSLYEDNKDKYNARGRAIVKTEKSNISSYDDFLRRKDVSKEAESEIRAAKVEALRDFLNDES